MPETITRSEPIRPTPNDRTATSPNPTMHINPNPNAGAPDFAPAPTMPPSASGKTTRWWLGVLVGLIVACPFGWILSYAASLPFYIGLFFFALLGLLLGAVTFRLAAPGRPFPRSAVLAGTGMLVLGAWAVSIVNEARDFPYDVARQVAAQTRDLGGQSLNEFIETEATAVRRYFAEKHPPGGTLGYVRWVVTRGELRRGSIESIQRTITAPQRKVGWLVRSALSLFLLSFGVGSQTLPLAVPRRSRAQTPGTPSAA